MQSNDLVLHRRKEMVGTLTWIALGLSLLAPHISYETDYFTPLFYVCAWVFATIWVALDAYLRYGYHSGWPILTILTGPVGFTIYYFARKPVPMICSRCGSIKEDSMKPCSACGYTNLFYQVKLAITGLYNSFSDSLVRSPVEKAKQTTKHLAFALAVVIFIGMPIVNMIGFAKLPLSVIWALSAAAYWVLVAWWVYLDSVWRKMDGIPWAVLTLVTNVIGLVTYLVIRYPDPKLCASCGASIPTGRKYCPFCGAETEAMCPHCQAPILSGWVFCPVCAAKLIPSEAAIKEDIYSDKTITISGIVLDGEKGIPIAGACVEVDSKGDTKSAITDTLGKFQLSGLDQRPYVIVASSKSYLSQARAYSPAEITGPINFMLYSG